MHVCARSLYAIVQAFVCSLLSFWLFYIVCSVVVGFILIFSFYDDYHYDYSIYFICL